MLQLPGDYGACKVQKAQKRGRQSMEEGAGAKTGSQWKERTVEVYTEASAYLQANGRAASVIRITRLACLPHDACPAPGAASPFIAIARPSATLFMASLNSAGFQPPSAPPPPPPPGGHNQAEQTSRTSPTGSALDTGECLAFAETFIAHRCLDPIPPEP